MQLSSASSPSSFSATKPSCFASAIGACEAEGSDVTLQFLFAGPMPRSKPIYLLCTLCCCYDSISKNITDQCWNDLRILLKIWNATHSPYTTNLFSSTLTTCIVSLFVCLVLNAFNTLWGTFQNTKKAFYFLAYTLSPPPHCLALCSSRYINSLLYSIECSVLTNNDARYCKPSSPTSLPSTASDPATTSAASSPPYQDPLQCNKLAATAEASFLQGYK